ncbi:hypothetical protein M011DRAFT_530161 [Sporormia fimetaria CBS 119925]|uniref:Uncharacterized protein n=1 Tax=Sporormia fimetaria CBS 119925 TaxID=1340428 RepID=A0A6A6UXA2_9PLEO|nr:hypothetical protein M011DRAFT_530161 [Sporormia fimetaria CBS 119925]
MTPNPTQKHYGLPDVPYHFWSPNNAAYFKINQINADIKASAGQAPGTGQSTHKRPITNMWAAICRLYYSDADVVTNGPLWSVDVETTQEEDTPDSVIIRTLHETAPWTQDYLRVECVKAAHDTAPGWKNLISHTVTKLTSSEADSSTNDNPISLVLAAGMKCMLFIWDPKSQLPGAQLRIRAEGDDGMGSEDAILDPRIKPPPFDTCYVDATGGEIIWSKAWKLDDETDPGTGDIPCGREMGQIEEFLCSVRKIPLAEKGSETTGTGLPDDLKPKV